MIRVKMITRGKLEVRPKSETLTRCKPRDWPRIDDLLVFDGGSGIVNELAYWSVNKLNLSESTVVFVLADSPGLLRRPVLLDSESSATRRSWQTVFVLADSPGLSH